MPRLVKRFKTFMKKKFGKIRVPFIQVLRFDNFTNHSKSLSIRDVNRENGLIFFTSLWIDSQFDDFYSLSPIMDHNLPENNTYCVIVHTSDELFAGTDEDIYLIIRGSQISSRPILLKRLKKVKYIRKKLNISNFNGIICSLIYLLTLFS